MEVNLFLNWLSIFLCPQTTEMLGDTSLTVLVLFIKESEPCQGSGLRCFIAPRIPLVKWGMGLCRCRSLSLFQSSLLGQERQESSLEITRNQCVFHKAYQPEVYTHIKNSWAPKFSTFCTTKRGQKIKDPWMLGVIMHEKALTPLTGQKDYPQKN